MGSYSRMTELPQPYDDPNLQRTFQGYRQALSMMTLPQLVEQANRNAEALQRQSDATLASTISMQLSDYQSSLDRLTTRSLPMGSQPSTARGVAASLPSPQRLAPSALDRLASSKYLAPRIAAKLVHSEVRRATKARANE